MTKRALTALALSLVVLLASAAPALGAPPANDNFPGFPLTDVNALFSGTNVDATGQPGEDDHADASREEGCAESDPTCITSVWWRWTAPRDGSVNINLCGSGFDTTLGVYTGSSVGALTEENSNDDMDSTEELGPQLQCPANRTASGVQFTALAGTTYHIAVAGLNADTGAIQGRITTGPLEPEEPNEGPCTNRASGSNGSDNLIGTPFGDVIAGFGGNDRIAGGLGDDCLFGNRGNDRLDGGLGTDGVSGGSGKDRVGGGAGNDVLSGDSGNDRVAGRSGNDLVAGGSGNDRIAGGAGNDRLAGDSGKDRLAGGSGNDRIKGGAGNDRIRARDRRRDRIDCGRGRDLVVADRRDRVRRCERVRRR